MKVGCTSNRSGILSISALTFVFVLFVFTQYICAPKAEALSATPVTGSFTTNGTVNAIAASTTGVYIGGTFTQVGTYMGYGVPATISNGTAVSGFPKINSDVYSAISDGSGGWYIGGTFSTVNTTSQAYVVHITSTGSVDTGFAPVLNGTVYAMQLSSDRSKLYIGGSFTTVGGVTYNRLAALNTSDGSAISAFNPNMGEQVNALALSSDDSRLYAGGTFTTVGGVTYNRLAEITTSNGTAVSAFNPNIGGEVDALVLSPDNTTVYAGGQFTTVGVATYNYLAAIATSTGAAVSAFNPNMGAGVNALAISSDGTRVYAGGTFTTVGGVTYNRLAAITTGNGAAVSAFNPNMNEQVKALALSSDGTKIYTGGVFTTVGGATYNRIAAITTSNGSAVSSFNPSGSDYVNAVALNSNGDQVFIGGFGPFINGYNRDNIAHINHDNTVDTNFAPSIDNTVNAIELSPDGTKVYAGGTFTVVGGTRTAYNRLAGFTVSNGAVISAFNPNMGSTVNDLEISPDGATLYVGGTFTTVGGVTYNRLAAITTSNGAAVSAFNPNMGNTVSVLALSSNGSTLYAGGTFTTVGGVTYNRLAAITTSNGAAVTAFNPSVDVNVSAMALKADDTRLYFGGQFTTVGGVTYNRLAAVTTADGVAISAFNPSVTTAGNAVRAMALNADESKLYVGGAFTTIAGGTHNRLVAVNTSDGSLDSTFDPDVNSTVIAVAFSYDYSRLYAGGQFTTVGSSPYYKYLALFPSVPTVNTGTNSSVGKTSATIAGEIASSSIETARGFAYGTKSDLSPADVTTSSSGTFGIGSFSSSISDLACGTTYYYKAYATNSAGTGYGNISSFTTEDCVARNNSEGGGSTSIVRRRNTEDTSNNTASTTPTVPARQAASSSPSIMRCAPYLTTNMSFGSAKNNPEEVKNLQSFLTTYEKENLETSGVFDQKTYEAVKRFQVKNPAILRFWNMTLPNGNAYVATRNVINRRYCEATTKIQCPYIPTYAKLGDKNDAVKKIKNFLNSIENANLDANSDLFDSQLVGEVTKFQLKYSDKILKPWKISSPTGNWYQTTDKQANDMLGCFNPIRLDNGAVLE